MLVAELCKDQTAEAKYAERVALGIIAPLDVVPIDVA